MNMRRFGSFQGINVLELETREFVTAMEKLKTNLSLIKSVV